MKFAFALLAVLGLALVPTQGDLIADMDRFILLVPWADVHVLHDDMRATDPAFAASDDFFHGARMTEMVLELDTVPEFGAYFDFIESKGVPGYYWLNRVREFMSWPLYPVPSGALHSRHARSVDQKSFTPFIEAILAILPVQDFIDTWDDLMATSPEFADMIALISDPEYRAVRAALLENPTYVAIDDEMIANGLDLTKDLDLIWAFFKDAYANQP